MRQTFQLRVQALAAAAIGLIAATQLTIGGDDTAVRVRGSLAPTPGPNSIGYVHGKRSYLERVAADDPDRPAAALISFSRLVPAHVTKPLLSAVRSTVVFVRLPQSEPDALHLMKPLDVTMAAAVQELAGIVRGEIVSISKQLENAQGPDRQHLENSLAERNAALAALIPDCPCVYAVAVEGTTLGALARLQKDPNVLLVDVPEPVQDDLSGWVLTPILPST
jgi:hypothetical protein